MQHQTAVKIFVDGYVGRVDDGGRVVSVHFIHPFLLFLRFPFVKTVICHTFDEWDGGEGMVMMYGFRLPFSWSQKIPGNVRLALSGKSFVDTAGGGASVGGF